VGNDAIALLMGQLLQRLERPQMQAQAQPSRQSALQPQLQIQPQSTVLSAPAD
jgi:hypothetical protein